MMPRHPRIQDEFMIHHIVARGNRKERVFITDGDRIRYLHLLERYRDRFNFSLFSYCLMDNHIHLLVRQSTTPLSKFMQGIQQSYTQYYNKKYATSGHVFQQRFTSYPCADDAYLLALIAYIHKNPKTAGMVTSLVDYRWSSHHEILKSSTRNLIDADELFALLGRNRDSIRTEYLAWVDEVDEEQIENMYLSKDEKEQVRAKAGYAAVADNIAKKRCTLPFVVSVLDEYQSSTPAYLNIGEYRKILTILCDRHTLAKTKEIAADTGISASRISRIRREFAEGKFPEDLQHHIDAVDSLVSAKKAGQA